MPIIRKINRRKDGSYLITLPKDWVENAEKEANKFAEAVLMEVDKTITLTVKFREEGGRRKNDY